jgi:hypothetical protein
MNLASPGLRARNGSTCDDNLEKHDVSPFVHGTMDKAECDTIGSWADL